MYDERKQKARERFRDFVATVVLRNEQFFIVDWRNKNGSGEYSVRYLLDIEKGNFIVTGDLGDSVASWFNRVTPENLKSYINDIGYYMGKFQTTSDQYTYDQDDVAEDLENVKEEILSECPNLYQDEVDADFEKMQELLDDMDLGENNNYTDELTELFEKYNDDWWYSGFANLGCRTSQRVILWAVGFQMVCEQLGI